MVDNVVDYLLRVFNSLCYFLLNDEKENISFMWKALEQGEKPRYRVTFY